MVKMQIVTAAMREYNRVTAPGSETSSWQSYCEDCRSQYGILPYRDGAGEIDVSGDFAAYWLAVARGDLDTAEAYGDVA